MLKVQARAVELLKEIDEICEVKGISYSLAGRTAAMQAVAEGFTCSDYRPEIMMMPSDYSKFCKAVSERKTPNRVIESLETNPKIDGVYARYVDTSTTLIDTVRASMCEVQGVHVLIWVLRSKSPSSKYSKTLDKIVRTNDVVSIKIKKDYRSGKARTKLTGLEMARSILRTPGTMKKFFAAATADDGKSKNLYYIDVADEGRKVKIPRKYMNNYRRVLFEGISVNVIDKISDMLKTNYGENVAEVVKTAVCPTGEWGVYYDLHHPFRQVVRESEANGTDFDRIAEQRADYNEFYAKKFKRLDFQARKEYRPVRRTINRFLLMQEYLGKEDEIEAMFKAGKIDETREALADYISMIEFYNERDLGFSFDKRLLEIAYKIMEIDGKTASVKKAKKLMPEEYKEDLSDWLVSEGFEGHLQK